MLFQVIWSMRCLIQVLPVYERLQQCLLVVVKQQQVGGQTEVAAQCLPLTRTCNYNKHTHFYEHTV